MPNNSPMDKKSIRNVKTDIAVDDTVKEIMTKANAGIDRPGGGNEVIK